MKRPSASESCGGKSKAQKKGNHADTSNPPVHPSLHPPSQPQKTISELFATSKRSATDNEVGALGDSTPSKRLKHDDSPQTQEQDSLLNPRVLHPDKMYSFASNSPRSKGFVDLTSDDHKVIDLTNSPTMAPSNLICSSKRPNGLVRPTNFTPQSGPRKLIVKNLRKIPRASPEDYSAHVWRQLDAALAAIFDNETVPYSNEELYKGVENLCRQGNAHSLYQKLCAKCNSAMKSLVLAPLARDAHSVDDSRLLAAIVAAWLSWSSKMTRIRSIFFYMDRSYLLNTATQLSIEEMGIDQFRTNIYGDQLTKQGAISGVCTLVTYDRDRASFADGDLLKKAISMTHVLGIYSNDCEPRLLEDSGVYFQRWSLPQVNAQNIADYLNDCQHLIDRETKRCDSFGFDLSTKHGILRLLDDIAIEGKKTDLIKTEHLSVLIEQNQVEALKQLYILLKRKNLHECLKIPFDSYIVKEGSAIVFDDTQENDMVIRLLAFKKKLDDICVIAFENHHGLCHSVREAFGVFINKSKKTQANWGTDNPKPGEMIAKYVDMILRGGVKAIQAALTSTEFPTTSQHEDVEGSDMDEDAVLGKQLDQVLDMFRFVHGKAVFEAFYKRDLARRLLMARSASADAEKSMLTRLRSECGAEFTHNLEQMFKDIDLAREEMISYKSMLQERDQTSPVDLSVNVLSEAAWPTYPDQAVQIPKDIQKATADFEAYYKMKHTGRKLSWKHGLAHCQIRARFPKGDKEIVVSSFQAIVMLLFNDRIGNEPLKYTEIKGATNLDDAELKRTLQSLACARYRVLTKSPRGKEVNETDKFIVNLDFKDDKYRIKINQIQLKETKEENKQTHERVAADRHYETQAAVVRIMKTRKNITHADLIVEVITATKSRGVLEIPDIKKNIDKLIEKDYMEREEDGSYSYLA